MIDGLFLVNDMQKLVFRYDRWKFLEWGDKKFLFVPEDVQCDLHKRRSPDPFAQDVQSDLALNLTFLPLFSFWDIVDFLFDIYSELVWDLDFCEPVNYSDANRNVCEPDSYSNQRG